MVLTSSTQITYQPRPPFQVGGSLSLAVPSYVSRQADTLLLKNLLEGQFCYVLNCRQMGKSSLLVHTLQALEQAGCLCVTLDITSIGTQQVTPAQWYRGIVADLWRGFRLFGRINYQSWWQAQGDVPPVQKLQQFLREVLLEEFPHQPLVILIDEIDSVLGVDFALDDFFALIRFCYNQRSLDAAYNRLTFGIFGVATPADLIQDRLRTPFNLGQSIPLEGFQPSECESLIAGLASAVEQPIEVLRAILQWTGGQPFLTQKLCALIWTQRQQAGSCQNIPAGGITDWVGQLVHDHILHQWELQDEPEHLRTIRDRLLLHPDQRSRLLSRYQQILRQGAIVADGSAEEAELLLSGLVVKTAGQLRVKNPIYQAVFNEDWIDYHLEALRPYAEAIKTWLHSRQQDASRLLRGQALQDAQTWAEGKRLSDEDYQFLSASAAAVSRDRQTALTTELASARTAAIAAQLAQSQRNERLQKRLLTTIGMGFILSLGLSVLAVVESQRANRNEQVARRSEIQALAASAQGWFDSGNRLDALMQAIRAQKQLAQLQQPNPALDQEVDAVLRKIILDINEVNRLAGHTAEVRGVAYRPDGQQIASASQDTTLKLWRPDGTLLQTLEGHSKEVLSVSYSPTGDVLATGGADGTVKVWNSQTGALLNTLTNGKTQVLTLAFSPDGATLAAGTIDGTITLWNRAGTRLQTIAAHQAMVRAVTFSPDGELLVSASADQTLKFWHPTEGRLLNTLTDHTATVADVAFSPDGQQLASASSDQTIKLWNRQGALLKTLRGHQSAVTDVLFSPDGQRLVSTSLDHDVRFWTATGEPFKAYASIAAVGKSLAFSPDGDYLVAPSASEKDELILWQLQSPLYTVIGNHSAAVTGVAHSPTSDVLVSAGANGDLKLWQTSGRLIKTLQGHNATVFEVLFSPDGQRFASSSFDGTVRLWQSDGTRALTYGAHQPDTARIAFAPDGGAIASVGVRQGVLRLWQPDGQALAPDLSVNTNAYDLAWPPHQGWIAIADGQQNIQLWHPVDQTQMGALTGHTANVRDLSFDATGNWLASADENGVLKLWETATQKNVATFSGHSDLVWDIQFAPPSAASGEVPFLASASADKTIRLRGLDGEPITVLDKHTAGVLSLAFSPDGQWLFSASSDQTLVRWNMPAILELDPLAYGCDWVADYLATNADVKPEMRSLCD